MRTTVALFQTLSVLAATAICQPAHGQTLTVLKTFSLAEGANPRARLLLSGSTLYGATTFGGTNNTGTIFRLKTDGSSFTVLKHLAPPGASLPLGPLALIGSTLYGTSRGGGSSGNGTVFKINTDGSGYVILKSFGSSDGAGPYAGLTLSGSTLYGTTYNGGTWDNGTVFKINTNGTGYAVLKHFNLDGVNPAGEMALAGNTFYGTTYNGGMSGTIFKIKTDGTGYSVLKTFAYADGNHPYAGVVLAGDSLYGAAYSGGTMSMGTLYRINTNGTGFTVLHTFNLTNGANPYATPTLSGNTLYGTAYDGGSSFMGGTIFKMNTDGSGFSVLKEFLATEPAGVFPYAGVTVSGTTLYGATCNGGAKANGVIFSLNTAPSPPLITSQPQTQTNLAGTNITFQVAATGSQPLSYQWRKNTNNLINSATVSGATSNTLNISNIQASDAGNYTVVIINSVGALTSAVATLTVIVKHPPLAGNDTVQVPLGLPLRIPVATLLANDSDPDGGALSMTAVQSPSALGTIVSLANGTITYWGGFDAPTDQFTYTLANTAGSIATGLITVTLTGSLPGTNQILAQALPEGGLRLITAGRATFRYSLDQAHDLTPPVSWEALETNWASARGYVFYTNTPSPGTATFYRARHVW